MIRRKDAPTEPSKFMGHGKCDHASKSVSLAEPTDNGVIIAKNCIALFKSQHIKPEDLRGIGIQATKLHDASVTSSSRTLMDFAHTVTSRELHERDRVLKATIQKDKEKQPLPGIQTFVKSNGIKSGCSSKNVVPPAPTIKLPPLPQINLDAETTRTNYVERVQQVCIGFFNKKRKQFFEPLFFVVS